MKTLIIICLLHTDTTFTRFNHTWVSVKDSTHKGVTRTLCKDETGNLSWLLLKERNGKK